MSTGCCTLASSRSAGDGVPVREKQPGDDEVPVVGVIAEVATVGERARTGASREAQAVVEPFPDEAALEPGVALDYIPVLLQAPRTVAHRVAVLAEQVRFVEVSLGAESREGGQVGVHGPVDVRHLGLGAALVVDEPGPVHLSCPFAPWPSD